MAQKRWALALVVSIAFGTATAVAGEAGGSKGPPQAERFRLMAPASRPEAGADRPRARPARRHAVSHAGEVAAEGEPGSAADSLASPPIASDGQTGTEAQPEVPEPKVTAVHRLAPPDEGIPLHAAGLGHTIRVKVDGLAPFLEATKKEGKKVHLFLDGIALKRVRPEGGACGENRDELQFTLHGRNVVRNATDDPEQAAAWASIFGFQDGLRLMREVTVSVGEEGGDPIPSTARLTLIRIRSDRALLCLGILVALVLVSVWACRKGILRDRNPTGSGAATVDETKLARSLGRTQMALWTLLTVSAFLFIWIVTWDLPEIPASLFALMGITGGTALAGVTVDGSKRRSAARLLPGLHARNVQDDSRMLEGLQQVVTRLKELTERIKGLINSGPSSAAGSKAPAVETKAIIEDLERLATDLKSPTNDSVATAEEIADVEAQTRAVTSRGPICDLLWDADGPSLHRLQLATWTLVLAVIFVIRVAAELALPDFDETLLALSGVSSATFVGFKFTEKQPAAKKRSGKA